MSRIRSSSVVSVFCSVVVCLGPTTPLAADEIAGTIWARAEAAEKAAKLESLLAAWSRAALENPSFDAKFTRWTYDLLFRDDKHPEVASGRVLLQRIGTSRYEVADIGGLLWRDDEYLIIDLKKRDYRRYGKIDWEAVLKFRREPPPDDLGWWDRFARGWSNAEFVHRTDVLPFLSATEMAELRADYDLTLETTPAGLCIAGSRKPERKARFENVLFAFRGGEPLPYATRISSAHRIVVHEFRETWQFRQAPDTAEFLNPDLGDLERIDFESLHETRGKVLGETPSAAGPR